MSREVLMQILEMARWAPSGDNTQPWRFEIVADEHIAIHGFDTREQVLYDFDGHASQMAHGALLETLRIAATAHQREAVWELREGCPEMAPIYDVRLMKSPGLPQDPLLPYVLSRTVQRRPMRTNLLTEAQRRALTEAVGSGFSLRFVESWKARLAVARMLWNSAYIRLTCPEAFQVHREIIEWRARFSTDRLPEESIGIDPMTARLMEWVMQSWARVQFFNRYLFGTHLPRLQLDFLPGIFCSAHILMIPERPPAHLVDHVHAGIALQRLWLTATKHGLHLQPEMTPVIFRWYSQARRPFSQSAELMVKADELAGQFTSLCGVERRTPFSFFCRVGHCNEPSSRSLRRSLSMLFK